MHQHEKENAVTKKENDGHKDPGLYAVAGMSSYVLTKGYLHSGFRRNEVKTIQWNDDEQIR